MRVLIKGCIDVVKWSVRWSWNGMIFFVLLLVGFFEAMLTLALGITVVLFLVGYPLLGVVFVFLGMILSIGVMSIIIAKLLKLQKKSAMQEDGKCLENNNSERSEVICHA